MRFLSYFILMTQFNFQQNIEKRRYNFINCLLKNKVSISITKFPKGFVIYFLKQRFIHFNIPFLPIVIFTQPRIFILLFKKIKNQLLRKVLSSKMDKVFNRTLSWLPSSWIPTFVINQQKTGFHYRTPDSKHHFRAGVCGNYI